MVECDQPNLYMYATKAVMSCKGAGHTSGRPKSFLKKTEHFYSSIVCPSSARSKRMVQQEVYFRSEIIERNSTGMSDGVCSAVGAKSLKRWSWKRDRESAKALFTWIFLDINNKTIGRTKFMTNFDVVLFIIKTRAWLSIVIIASCLQIGGPNKECHQNWNQLKKWDARHQFFVLPMSWIS